MTGVVPLRLVLYAWLTCVAAPALTASPPVLGRHGGSYSASLRYVHTVAPRASLGAPSSHVEVSICVDPGRLGRESG